MKSKNVRKFFSIILSLSLMLQIAIPTVYAQESNLPIIIGFTELGENAKNKTVQVGTEQSEFLAQLPNQLEATTGGAIGLTLYRDENDFKWESDKSFSTAIEDEFIFTPQLLGEVYTLADDVDLPRIKVKVVDPGLVQGAVYGGDITEKGLRLNEGLPGAVTQYTAGDGYVLFTPGSDSSNYNYTIELNNASIEPEDSAAIFLEKINEELVDVELVITGDNKLGNSETGRAWIEGQNTNLSITGSGSLNIEQLKSSNRVDYGIYLHGESEITCDPNARLNAITYTENSEGNKIEVFGEVKIFQGFGEEADLILHEDSELTLQRRPRVYYTEQIELPKCLYINQDAKLIINEGITFYIDDYEEGTSIINNGGSIIVKGNLKFRCSHYPKDIKEMNVTSQGKGAVLWEDGSNEHNLDPVSGKVIFNVFRGLDLGANNGGEYICDQGTMIWAPLANEDGELAGGTLTLDNVAIRMGSYVTAIYIDDDNSIPISLKIIGDNLIDIPEGEAIVGGITDVKLTGSGTLTVKGGRLVEYTGEFDLSSFAGKLNAIVNQNKNYGSERNGTAYGRVSHIDYGGYSDYSNFTVAGGADLTIEMGSILKAGNLINQGIVINNGILCLVREITSDEELKTWIYGNGLKLKGNGIVKVYKSDNWAMTQWGTSEDFTNDGVLLKRTTEALDFSRAEEDMGDLATDGYHWDHQQKKLTLQNLNMADDSSQEDTPAIKLPEGQDVSLELKGTNQIKGFVRAIGQGELPDIDDFMGPDDLPEAQGSLTVSGDGTLLVEAMSQDGDTNILETTGKFILEGGNLAIMGLKPLASMGMEIKAGSIGAGIISAPIMSYGDFTMTGGKLTAANGRAGLGVVGDLTLSGGELILGQSSMGIMVVDGNVAISGGKLKPLVGEDKYEIGIFVGIMGNEDKKISISGGEVDIRADESALEFMAIPGPGDRGKGIFETKGMIVKTDPEDGRLKAASMNPEFGGGTIYALTADDELELDEYGSTLLNASTSLTAVKAPAKPSDNDEPSGDFSGGGPSDKGDSATITPSKDPDSPKKATTLVKSNVTKGTAKVSLEQSLVAEAIKKAQEQAKKDKTEKNGITLEIKVDTKDSSVQNLSANLPKETVDELIKANVRELSINSASATINLDLESLKAIQSQVGSQVEISATKLDNKELSLEAKALVGDRPVYDFSITGAKGQKVRRFGKGKISIAIPYTLAADEKAENIVAYYIDDTGDLYEMPDSLYDEKKGTLSFKTDHFSKFAVGYKNDEEPVDVEVITFTDITNHWAEKDIEFVTARGLFGGTAEGIFAPNIAMTRGMLVTVLSRLAKADLTSYLTSSFVDVKTDTYYMPSIEWAREKAIVSGMSQTEFAPNQAITREQMAAIISNYAKASGVELPEKEEESDFADSEMISAYAKEAVRQMQMAGIISGRDDKRFDPKGTATRAEVSAVLKRLIELSE